VILDYEIVYSDRKTIGITVERNSRVVVRAPCLARAEAVSAVVESKRYWIWQKLRDPRKYLVRPLAKEFVAGETFLYLGLGCALGLVGEATGQVNFASQLFTLGRSERRRARTLFREWYMAEAKTHLVPRVAMLAKSMGVDFRRISIRDLKYRWGSCTPGGTLVFNWRIVQAPPMVIDYLVVHELAHLLEQNHSPEFWNIVQVHAPAATKARTWLRIHGHSLYW
jgi:predicted metal-dependent hydrolase